MILLQINDTKSSLTLRRPQSSAVELSPALSTFSYLISTGSIAPSSLLRFLGRSFPAARPPPSFFLWLTTVLFKADRSFLSSRVTSFLRCYTPYCRSLINQAPAVLLLDPTSLSLLLRIKPHFHPESVPVLSSLFSKYLKYFCLCTPITIAPISSPPSPSPPLCTRCSTISYSTHDLKISLNISLQA